jgi:alkyl hydroperoxide reductase subunit AhpC
MGMVDMRSTFIIDPSGIIRGVAEGVLKYVLQLCVLI